MEDDSTVFVVDDDDAMLDSLGTLLRSEGYRAETFSSAQAFLDAYSGAAPGCLIVDVRMPGLSGTELHEKITRQNHPLAVIIMTGFGNIRMAVQAMRAGAVDFVEKPFDPDLILESVRRGLQTLKQPERRDHAETLERFALLTDREREVLEQIAIGSANKRVAEALGISVRTVEVHRARIYEKMKATSLSHLVRMALQVGLDPDSD